MLANTRQAGLSSEKLRERKIAALSDPSHEGPYGPILGSALRKVLERQRKSESRHRLCPQGVSVQQERRTLFKATLLKINALKVYNKGTNMMGGQSRYLRR